MTAAAPAKPFQSSRSGALCGRIRVPGDKSISHRALMFGALAIGETTIRGLLEGEDVLHTAAALRAMGARVHREPAGVWRVQGVGVGGLAEPAAVLDMGNSGTAARLMIGLMATHPFTSFFTGDASLNKRPMARIIRPLQSMGAQFACRSGERLPLAVIGTPTPLPLAYALPVPSAQVKSAVLLAGLNTPGATTVIEKEPTRDHSERMLQAFGATVTTQPQADGTEAVTIIGQPELKGQNVQVPGDPSSAAFPVVAALLRPGSDLVLEGIGANPRRTGLYQTLQEMGGDLSFDHPRELAGEPVADVRVRASGLKGVRVPASRAPSMIDEYPVLAVAAACAEGTTILEGLAELKVKESDRLAMMATGLEACGVRLEVEGDTLIIHGTGHPPAGGVTVATAMDHRIAMSFLVLGTATPQPVVVDDVGFIETSFPGFIPLMTGLGAEMKAMTST